MFSELIILGGFLFWLLVAAEFIVLVACMHKENGIIATLSVFVFCLILYFFGSFNVLAFITGNWKTILLWSLGYIPIGVVWAITKIYFKGRARDRRYLEAKEEWLSRNPGRMENDWLDYHYNGHHADSSDFIIRQMCKDALLWVTYWPVSMFWTLLSDFIMEIFKEIHFRLTGFYKKILQKAIKNIISDEQKYREMQKTKKPAENC